MLGRGTDGQARLTDSRDRQLWLEHSPVLAGQLSSSSELCRGRGERGRGGAPDLLETLLGVGFAARRSSSPSPSLLCSASVPG